MSNRRHLRRRDNGMSCGVCGAPDNDETTYGVTVKADSAADAEKLVAYSYEGMNPGGMPNVRPLLMLACPGHTDADFLRAGIVPPQMIDKMPGLRKALDEWLEQSAKLLMNG